MSLGPLQVLVINFDEATFEGEVEAEFTRLEETGTLKVHDVLVVRQPDDGANDEVRSRQESAGALLGAGDGSRELNEDESSIADAIERGGGAASVIVEHTWAIPLRAAIERAGGQRVVAEWATPEDLAAMGIPITT
jgi:hypothetical protein